MRAKVDIYLFLGVHSVWVVHMERESVGIYEAGTRVTLSGDMPIHSTAVPGLCSPSRRSLRRPIAASTIVARCNWTGAPAPSGRGINPDRMTTAARRPAPLPGSTIIEFLHEPGELQRHLRQRVDDVNPLNWPVLRPIVERGAVYGPGDGNALRLL